MSKPGLLTLTIKDKSALYLAYMPYVINGGLFIPTNSSYRLGDEVFMLLNLMGEEEKIPVAGTVIWMTPKGAQGKRTAGIGVNVHYIPVHTQPYYRDLRPAGYDPMPNAMGYYARAISLPMYPTMTEDQQDQVVAALTQILT